MIEVPILLLVAAALVSAIGGAFAFIFWTSAKTWERNYNGAITQMANNTRSNRTALVSDKKHGLKWLNKNTSGSWMWTCECGHEGKVVVTSNSNPSEEKAILQWKSHVETHEKYLVPTHEHSHAKCDQRFVGLWSLFEQYRTACYCQTTSNDLIMLNQEVKKFEQKEIEKTS